jgi:hypothetical protein
MAVDSVFGSQMGNGSTWPAIAIIRQFVNHVLTMFLEKLTDAQIGCQPRLGAGYGHCFLPATSGWLPSYPLMEDLAGLFFPSFALLPLLCLCV